MLKPLFCAAEDSILVAFLTSSLFFVLMVAFSSCEVELIGPIIFFVLFCAGLAGLGWAALKFDKKTSAATAFFLLAFIYAAKLSAYFSSLALSLFLLSFPFAWLKFVKKRSFKQALKEFRFTSKGLLWNIAAGIILTVFLLYPLMLAEVLILKSLGVTDIENVGRILLAAPIWLILVSFTLAPVAEELFFRAFLIPRFGVLGSTVLFTLAHYSYGSATELIGAFTIGLALALLFLKTRSIASVITAHIVFNLISIIVIFFGAQFLPEMLGLL
jgi:membrane protease YdiL (CAAX protease family)